MYGLSPRHVWQRMGNSESSQFCLLYVFGTVATTDSQLNEQCFHADSPAFDAMMGWHAVYGGWAFNSFYSDTLKA